MKSFIRFQTFHGYTRSHALTRALLLLFVISMLPFLRFLRDSDPLYADDCAGELSSRFMKGFAYENHQTLECQKSTNLTRNVVKELMAQQLLNYNAKALCVGKGSFSEAFTLRRFGFSDVLAAFKRPYFSIWLKKFVYRIENDDNSFDFVFSKDIDKVTLPAIVVVEIERVLRPGGLGAFLVGGPGPDPGSLVKPDELVSSFLKNSNVVHVGSLDPYTMVVFKKRLDNVTYFDQYKLPKNCRSIPKNKGFIEKMEPLVEEKPLGLFDERVLYLPKLIDMSSKKELVYIDIGTRESMNSSTNVNWFLPSYPIDPRAFDVYAVDGDWTTLLLYVTRPGIGFVYHPGLAGNESKVNSESGGDLDSSLEDDDEDESFDFVAWFKRTVKYADFVVVKMNGGSVELKLLIEMFETGAICAIDELFLNCPDHGDGDCMDLFKGLRSRGVFVHQWWGKY